MSFKATNYLIFDQSNKELDNELLEEFNPWMTSKTFSFYNDGEFVNYINDFLNGNTNLFKTKDEQFKYFENIIPRQKYKRISYIKKTKKEKVEEVPIPEFYSRREIDLFENLNK
jgi:hypothetical protein